MASNVASASTSINPYETLNHYKRLRFTSKAPDRPTPFTPAYVKARLKKSKNVDADAVYDSRVTGRQLLLENPVKDSTQKKQRLEKLERRKQATARAKLNVLGKTAAKRRGIWKLSPEESKYSLFLPLHHLWLGYMAELLGLGPPPAAQGAVHTMPNSSSVHPKLVRADFHGSILTVKQSKCPSLVGLSGIVVLETENTFKIITEQDQTKMLPKQNTIFALRIPIYDTRGPYMTALGEGPSEGATIDVSSLPQMEFELYGNQFRFRSADRASKKFKPKETIEL